MPKNEEEKTAQKKLHEAIEEYLHSDSDFEGMILTGWVIAYEYADLSGNKSSCGHFYGPLEMTTWKALGLIEWVRRFTLAAGADQDEQGD